MGLYKMLKVYARRERKDGTIREQELHEHLIGTMEIIEELVRYDIIASTLNSLSRIVNVDFNLIVESCRVSALLHDIGKALWYYQRDAEVKDELRFKDHEIISAYIVASAFQEYLSENLEPMVEPSWVEAVIL